LLGCEEAAGAEGAAVEGVDVAGDEVAGLVDWAGVVVICDAWLGELL
jgi:hypothetical protein